MQWVETGGVLARSETKPKNRAGSGHVAKVKCKAEVDSRKHFAEYNWEFYKAQSMIRQKGRGSIHLNRHWSSVIGGGADLQHALAHKSQRTSAYTLESSHRGRG